MKSNTQNTITCLLIDDEENNIIYLEGLLNKYFPNLHVIGKASNAPKAIELIKRLNPQLLFLDIEMPTLNGFDLLKQVQTIVFETIFVTAYNHYAIQAFEVNAIGYITKPIAEEKFMYTVKNAISRIDDKSTNYNLIQILSSIKQEPQNNSIPLPTLHGLVFVKQSEIIYCESQGNYTNFYLDGNRKIVVSRQLGEYEKILPENLFIRIHDKYIINQTFIVEYVKGIGGEIKLVNGIILPVAVRKKDALLQRFEKWLKRK
jgi:two-component system LytT family response regulator